MNGVYVDQLESWLGPACDNGVNRLREFMAGELAIELTIERINEYAGLSNPHCSDVEWLASHSPELMPDGIVQLVWDGRTVRICTVTYFGCLSFSDYRGPIRRCVCGTLVNGDWREEWRSWGLAKPRPVFLSLGEDVQR